jgi:prepilin-type N-terminal cleavage/methylation domain-containing protein
MHNHVSCWQLSNLPLRERDAIRSKSSFGRKPGMADEQRRWFTLTELLVCIVLFGLIVALLGPNMDEGRERARLTTCYNNLR